MVTARRPPSSKTTYKKEVAVNDNDTLLKFLGIDPELVKEKKKAKAVLTDDMWATLDDDDAWDEEPEVAE